METTEIVLSILGFLQVCVVSWAVWVTQNINKLDKELSLNTQRDGDITELIKTVNTRLADIDAHLSAILIALARNNIDVDNPKK